jgi:hypothetical protein
MVGVPGVARQLLEDGHLRRFAWRAQVLGYVSGGSCFIATFWPENAGELGTC